MKRLEDQLFWAEIKLQPLLEHRKQKWYSYITWYNPIYGVDKLSVVDGGNRYLAYWEDHCLNTLAWQAVHATITRGGGCLQKVFGKAHPNVVEIFAILYFEGLNRGCYQTPLVLKNTCQIYMHTQIVIIFLSAIYFL